MEWLRRLPYGLRLAIGMAGIFATTLGAMATYAFVVLPLLQSAIQSAEGRPETVAVQPAGCDERPTPNSAGSSGKCAPQRS
jgi:hypothetical protein